MRFPTLWRKAAHQARSKQARSKDNAAAAALDSPVGILRGRFFTFGVPIVHPETMFQASLAMQHPIVYRCVNKIAETVASVDFRVRKRHMPGAAPCNTLDAVEQQIQAVLDRPCDEFSAYHIRYWMAANFAVYGNIPVKVGRTWDGIANAIYPLSNVSAQVVGDKAGRIVGYKFAGGEGATYELPSRQFVEVRERDGANSRGAWACVIAKAGLDILALDNSPTRAAALPVELFSLLMQRGHETASGHSNKNYLIATEHEMTAAQEDAIYAMLQESRVGGSRSGQVGFVSGGKPEVVALNNDLSDLHSKIPLDDMTRQICGIWGIPVALMGLGGADNAKYAGNYESSRSAFYEDTIVPGYLSPISEGLTAAICPAGYEVYPDLDSVEALRDARMSRMRAAGEIPFLSANEKRKMFDLPAIEGGEGLGLPVVAHQTQSAPSKLPLPEG